MLTAASESARLTDTATLVRPKPLGRACPLPAPAPRAPSASGPTPRGFCPGGHHPPPHPSLSLGTSARGLPGWRAHGIHASATRLPQEGGNRPAPTQPVSVSGPMRTTHQGRQGPCPVLTATPSAETPWGGWARVWRRQCQNLPVVESLTATALVTVRDPVCMFVCARVCMYARMPVHVCVCACVCFVCMFVYACLCARVHVCVCARVYVCLYECVCVLCVCMYVRVCACLCMHVCMCE